MKKTLLLLLMMFLFAGSASAEINAVATLPWIANIAKEIGKDRVHITVLVKPNQDPHFIEAKPGMILAARKADIVMYNGLDLEMGYLPRIIESSSNPKIQFGKRGNLDCSQFVSVIERYAAVDRSMGDTHPLGNPHYNFSPENVLRVAEGIAGRLSEIDGGSAAFYSQNLQSFKERFRIKQAQWKAMKLKGKRFVAYHKEWEYLAHDFGFEIIAYVEPKPGIPPSAAHIAELIEMMKRSKPDGIVTTFFYPKREVDMLSSETGIKVINLPSEVGSNESPKDWFGFMDSVTKALR
jgi:zinc/manganese transport system substrate-binding protein